MSHRQGIPRRQPPQGRSSRGSGTPAGRVAPMGRRSSGRGDADVRTQPAPAPHVPRPSPSPSPGPHRVKGWELKAGHRPLQEELLRGGEGQAQIEGKLGVRVPVRQEGVAGPGVRAPGGRWGSHQAVCAGEVLLLPPWGPVGWASSRIWNMWRTRPGLHQQPGDRVPHTAPSPGPYLLRRRCPR